MMKINLNNAHKIEEMLARHNGKAAQHVYRFASELRYLAASAEAELTALGLAKKDWPGAQYRCSSGDKLPGAYKWARKATSVTLQRGSSDWFLVRASAFEKYPTQGEAKLLLLTAKQTASAYAVWRSKFDVQQQAQSISPTWENTTLAALHSAN